MGKRKKGKKGKKNLVSLACGERRKTFFLFPLFPSSPFSHLTQALFIALVRLYQCTLGAILPNACRFSPTCSEYAIQAVRKHGAFKGAWLAFKRILRCNQLFKGGRDPVP